ncbi:MAG: nicotinate (nicotinamide) nucleotide adenylyltransferase [Desulfobacteraceae bacterium]|nr:nicotinate (nicotinamide) nucleotide adenylyltransferase [Desulfobacteraceae bacterium]MBC2756623.1 nicotinate (nicotinamide) nucleotide adenylyltransferase [Desulfobacteraceae bacterium]
MNGIGLFGGTFNPLHNGHLKVAEDVKAGFKLEKIYFIPSAVPPHKGADDLADEKDRFQMIKAAIPPGRGFMASDVEIHRQGPSYTIDTVRYFKNKLPESTPCYLIVGIDAFLEIDTWKSFQKLFGLIPFIVMTRPAEETKRTAKPSAELGKYIHGQVDPGYEFLQQETCFVHPTKQSVYLFHVTPLDISSTKIRNFVRQGVSIKRMVPGSVEKYIHKKGLYL